MIMKEEELAKTEKELKEEKEKNKQFQAMEQKFKTLEAEKLVKCFFPTKVKVCKHNAYTTRILIQVNLPNTT